MRRSRSTSLTSIMLLLALVSAGSLCAQGPADTGKGTVDKTVSSTQKMVPTTVHEPFIRQAYELAVIAGKKGNHTFGALLVYQGKVILTSENTVNTDRDHSRHAEINLLVKARRDFPKDVLREATMYTSTAPCMLCCSDMRYSAIGKVVYGVSYEAFAKKTGYKDPGIPCDKLYQYTGGTLEWIGPVLEEEGLKVFDYLRKEDKERARSQD